MKNKQHIKKKVKSFNKQEQKVTTKKVNKIIRLLEHQFPDAKTALVFSNPLQLLISTILSAQCTDERVNLITPFLYKKYKTVYDFANADIQDLERLIRSTGFYKSKAKYIKEASMLIVERYNGEIPKTMSDLLTLPGVGRKTANCVLSGAFGINLGFIVDTHVKRISKRLGLTKNDDPDKIEEDLIKIIPQKEWYHLSNLFILLGRKICRARNPLCNFCDLVPYCPSAFMFSKLK